MPMFTSCVLNGAASHGNHIHLLIVIGRHRICCCWDRSMTSASQSTEHLVPHRCNTSSVISTGLLVHFMLQ